MIRKILLFLVFYKLISIMAGITPLDQTISQIGYALHLPGAGISRPAGAPYSPTASPSNIYSTISQYGGAQGTAYSDVKGTSQPGSSTYIPPTSSNNMNTGGQVQGPSTTPTIEKKATPERDWSNPANWGFDVDGMHFQTPTDYQNFLDSKNNGNAQNALLAEIDKSANEGYGVLDTQSATLQSQYPADETNLINKVDLQKTTATNEGEQLTSDTQDAQQKQFGEVQNAMEGAIRAFNALKQQAMARYGLGSSTGGAVSDLANQEFYRQQGGLNEQKVDIGTQFAKEFNKIKLFTKGKIDELDQYKNEAVDALKKDLADRLNNIAVARAGIGQNKAQMRLSAIQDTISSAREIANQATTFRQTLAASALNNMQQVAGRAFTQAEIKATLNDYGITGFGNIGTNTTSSVDPNYYGKTNDQYDAFGNKIDSNGNIIQ